MSRAPGRAARRLLQGIATRTALAGAALAMLAAGGAVAPSIAAAAPVSAASSPAASSELSASAFASPAALAALPSASASPLAGSAAAIPDGEYGIVVSPRSDGVLQPGADLTVDVEIVNRSADALDAGEVVLYLGDASIDTRYGLDRWLSAADAGPRNDLGTEIGRISAPEVPAGERRTVSLTVPATSIPYDEAGVYAPYGVAARHMIHGGEFSQGRSTIVWNGRLDTAATQLATIVPITAPLSAEPVISATTLAALTSEGGRLDLLLDAVEGTRATLAIDPRVPASIRLLGAAAPPEATAWLERLESLPNSSFALPYADVDEELLQAAGLPDGLAPASLGALVDPADFAPPQTESPGLFPPLGTDPGATASPDASATATATDGTPADDPASAAPDAASPVPDAAATPSGPPTTTAAQPTPGDGVAEAPAIPSDAELLAVPATMTGVAWPAAGSLSPGDLDRLAAEGASLAVLDPANVKLEDVGDATPDAAATVDGRGAVVLDAQLDAALAAAAGATSEAEWDAAAAELATTLAVVSRERPETARTLAAAAPRLLPDDPRFLGRTLRLLDSLAWADLAPLASAAAPSGSGDREPRVGTLLPAAEDAAAVDRVQQLLAAEQRAFALSSMYDDPPRFRETMHASLYAALSSGWRSQPEQWAATVDAYRNYVAASEGSVVIVPTSDIQLVGQSADLPVFIQNNGSQRVTVQVALKPNTALLEARDPVTITIEPGSMSRAYLGVNAIANGVTSADVSLLTPDGVPISMTQTLNVNVRAEWESIGLGLIIALIAVLLVAGVYRTIRRRRVAAARLDDGADLGTHPADHDPERPRSEGTA